MNKQKSSSKENKFSSLPPQSRRSFLRTSALTMAAASLAARVGKAQNAPVAAPYIGNVKGANDKINVACIGNGGQGASDTGDIFGMKDANLVALCDVDRTHTQDMAAKVPEAKIYQDFRTMLDEMDSSIDAVTVTIPDHNHAIATLSALKMGKHVFCQKPLTQTVWEARQVRELANAKHLATQMGNQGSSSSGLRRAVEIVQAGVIGNVSELHVWSNRPIWPQGLDRPKTADVWSATLDWDHWIGPAKLRPFKDDVYHGFKWRGWYDFGCGALGDMACHTVNMPSRALKLGYPTMVELEESSELFPETFPKTSRIRFDFPEREGLPPMKFWWYDGDPNDKSVAILRPPDDVTKDTWDIKPPEAGKAAHLAESGALLVGDKGMLFSPDDYGEQSYIMLKGEKEYVEMQNHPAARSVPQTIPRSPGHKQEWFRMMRGGPPAYSNFDIAAYLTEIILLGCVALRVGPGKKMEWDGPKMMSPSHPEAAQYVRRANRRGWVV
jgi:predicted dehydrogenase